MDLSKVRFLFIGGVPHEREASCVHNKSLGMPQFAAEKFQENFLEKLNALVPGQVDFVSMPYTGSYMMHTKLTQYRPIQSTDGNKYYISFSTLPGLYSFSRKKALSNFLSKKFPDCQSAPNVIFVYAIHFPFIKSALSFSKKYSSKVKVILIIPDFPQFTNNERKWGGGIKGFFKYIYYRDWESLVEKFDGYIVFSDEIIRFLDIKECWFTMYGLTSPFDSNDFFKPSEEPLLLSSLSKSSKAIKFIYAGGLSFKYGIKELVDAVVIVSKSGYSISLFLCGSGDAVEYIINTGRKFGCINYLGVQSHSRVISMQREADFLVNPRPSTTDFVKYSFPSKMLEYSKQGKPIIAFNLPSYPKELTDALITPRSEDAEGIAQCMIEAIQLSECEIDAISKRSRTFFDTYCSDSYFENGISSLLYSVLNK